MTHFTGHQIVKSYFYRFVAQLSYFEIALLPIFMPKSINWQKYDEYVSAEISQKVQIWMVSIVFILTAAILWRDEMKDTNFCATTTNVATPMPPTNKVSCR